MSVGDNAPDALTQLAERVDQLERAARLAATTGRRGRVDLVATWMRADDIERAAFRRFLVEQDRFAQFVETVR